MKTLQSDLQIEIENSKKLANTHTNRSLKNDDLKHGWVTKLYEDMTDFLVMGVREEEVGEITGEPELIYVCVYSTSEATTSETKGRTYFQVPVCLRTNQLISHVGGLNFSLRVFKEDDEKGERKEKCLYNPKYLEQESQEFIDGLGFLSDTFTFWKSQMEVFYERLKSTMSDMSGPPEEEA